jgi:uncharacterized protein YaaR (DUF327 family)
MRIKKSSKTNRTDKIKSKKKIEDDVNRISFIEILATTEEDQMRSVLTEVLEQINKKGKELVNSRTVENL